MVNDLLKETDALLSGHFLLTSGRHSDGYVQCARLLMYPDKSEKVMKIIVDKLGDLEFDIVVGPAMGGIIVSYEIGRQTGKPSLFVERENGKMTLRRGFNIEKGQRVLIVEDVVTTGKSTIETLEVVEQYGGVVVGIACIVDRTVGDLEYPLYSATKLHLNFYEEDECVLCKSNIPIYKPGSRKM